MCMCKCICLCMCACLSESPRVCTGAFWRPTKLHPVTAETYPRVFSGKRKRNEGLRLECLRCFVDYNEAEVTWAHSLRGLGFRV